MGDDVGLRELKRARTRTAITRAAHELFRERGFERTTVEHIARRAEVAVQTVFNHMSSKEEMFFADRIPWVERVAAPPCAGRDETCGQAVVRQLTEASVGYLQDLADPAYLDMAAQIEAVPALGKYERAVHTRAEETLAGHLGEAGLSAMPRLTAALLLATTRVHAHEHRQRVIAGTPLDASLRQVADELPHYLTGVLAVVRPPAAVTARIPERLPG